MIYPHSNEQEHFQHYGVKGMKWGVRKRRERTANPVTLKETPGKYVQGHGGENQSASEDAKRVAVYRQTAKRSTTDALSTKELRDLVDRMNLEQQYNRLKAEPQRKSRAQKFISGQIDAFSKNPMGYKDEVSGKYDYVKTAINESWQAAKKKE